MRNNSRLSFETCDKLLEEPSLSRRSAFLGTLFSTLSLTLSPQEGICDDFVDLPALRGKGYGKSVKVYSDYVLEEGGLQFKDIRIGLGEEPSLGDRIVVDWDAYAVGYYGRIIQAKNLAKGGSFEGNDSGFLRFALGSAEVIPGIQAALSGMKVGGIRRVIIPPGPLSYPEDPRGFKKARPQPSVFGGARTLDFVMNNAGGIDKTLLFDIELLGIGENAKARRAPGTW
eukprot:CAMPEP_0196588878 /NCGR_PEP_ID=MMETSP1081-20130531/61993_1 /TAXON_ID=36882 /ORGANISM="Pyramimonas amylifera, Strain CCMP720" /LENGTH=227 /DNA_ID=CAMNT_0041911511 /DNA_START=134 /DNA_END=814 /DNA_ORIENTATION=+